MNSTESHILEDVNRCVMALEERDSDALRRTADAICGRSMRVCSVVSAEMDNYEPGNYTTMVLKAVNNLKLVGGCLYEYLFFKKNIYLF